MRKPDVFTTLGGGYDSFSRSWVPLKLVKPMGKSLPRVVRNWLGLVAFIELDHRIFQKCGTNMGRMVDDRVAAWAKVRVFGSPSIVGIRAPDVDEWSVLVSIRVLGLLRVA